MLCSIGLIYSQNQTRGHSLIAILWWTNCSEGVRKMFEGDLVKHTPKISVQDPHQRELEFNPLKVVARPLRPP
jgi:hypothetical protein